MQDISTNSQPLVSVVIATYNMGQYIRLAVESVLNQSWENIEVVVVDDGSTDNTQIVMQHFQGNARVLYIKTENQGQPKAKNCGIKNTKGDFIAFCDADDLWEPNKLEVQMPLFHNPDVGVVYSEVSNIDEYNNRYTKPPAEIRYSGKVTNQMLIENFVPFGTAVIRRQCIEKNGIFDEEFRMGIDWDLWLRYSLDWEFAYTPEQTYIYRVWSGQMSNNYRGRYEFAIRILNKFIAQHGSKLDQRYVKKAWADMHIREAIVYAKNEKLFLMPLQKIIRGLWLDPLKLYGWKSLAKLILGKH
ncbi:MAG TPA: glycosyltransferase family A protein [Cellvibrio sp.]